MSRYTRCLLVFLVAATACHAALGLACAWDDAALQDGKVLVRLEDRKDGQRAEGRAAGVIDCPPRQVWAVLNDYEHLEDFMPGVARSRVESVEGDTVVYFEEDHVPILKNPWFVLRCEHDNENLTKTMTRVDGSYRELRARWTLVPFGDGETLAEYTVVSDPGFYVPRWVRKQILNRTVKGFFRGLRDECTRRKQTVSDPVGKLEPEKTGFD